MFPIVRSPVDVLCPLSNPLLPKYFEYLVIAFHLEHVFKVHLFQISTNYSCCHRFWQISIRIRGNLFVELRRTSPLTDRFICRKSLPSSFSGLSERFESSSVPRCLYILIAFCTQQREILSCFEIWTWLNPASCTAAT